MKATLKVSVIEGRDLAAKDRTGTSDPFVSIRLVDQTYKTPTVHKSLNPVWGSDYTFTLTEAHRNASLVFTVFDKDLTGKDFLGMVQVPLSDLVLPNVVLYDSPDTGVWYKLCPRNPKDSVKGDLNLKIGFAGPVDPELIAHLRGNIQNTSANLIATDEPTDEAPDNVENIKSSLASMDLVDMNHNELAGLLRVDIVSAKDLVAKSCFPFCTLAFGKKAFRTRVLRQTLNPEWNERAFIHLKKHEIESNWILQCNIHNNHSLPTADNEVLGTAQVSIRDIIDKAEKLGVKRAANQPTYFEPVEFVLPLKARADDDGSATLLLRFSYASYEDIRRNFWINLATVYDSNGDQRLNHTEITTMFDSLRSSLGGESIQLAFFGSINDESVSFDEFARNAEKKLKATSDIKNSGKEMMVVLDKCIICGKSLDKSSEMDVITHVALCGFEDPGKVDRFLLGNFLTESNASRKWYTKILETVGFGGYQSGSETSANILVQNRATGQLEEEKMPVYIRMGIRLLYQDRAGRTGVQSKNIKALFKRLSLQQGKKFDDPASTKEIAPFVAFHNLDVNEILDPLDSFKTFNEFFSRKLKKECRTLASSDPKVAVSGCDCRVAAFQTVADAQKLWIKGRNFTIKSLLGPGAPSGFDDASVLIFRLSPQDYHRFHSPVDGKVTYISPNLGETYFTVNPMAIRSSIDVYTENVRRVIYIESPDFGLVAVVNVGAMLVGSVIITATVGATISRMDELGYYQFGGSTTIVLFQKDRILIDKDLVGNSDEGLETLVRMGNRIGISK
ncbi:phosphatidylserine decarboxylase [Synchytrium microbalum]|uniref:Phosphatidylserine decarboxylase n=1 Tax=Synchytrium microbalum TaxID=1806994 RepID=A0A507BZA4_9FUNG|nr:phosphatidylserine decarboxylase [Synchytrium microbalum]TPX32438.1 phosphatidylserine decarboxylase [Synchytrium microbalum]